jgi:hypothetical protein
MSDGTLPAPLGTGVCRGNQAQELHEFLGGIDAREVAEFGTMVTATVNCTPRQA